MAYRGARIRTRGGRGMGYVPYMANIDYNRSDQNVFEVLLCFQDGDGIDMSGTVDTGGFTIVRKRQRVNTGGTENVLSSDGMPNEDLISKMKFGSMSQDQMLSKIFSALTCSQSTITYWTKDRRYK